MIGCTRSARYFLMYTVVAPQKTAAAIARVSPKSIDRFHRMGFPLKTRYAPTEAKTRPTSFAKPICSFRKIYAPMTTTKGERFMRIQPDWHV